MHKEEFQEYNGIKVGDTIETICTSCFSLYEDWINTYGFDKTKWRKHSCPEVGTLCKVLGIGTHLDYDRSSIHEDYSHILFYVGNEKQTWIIRDDGVKLVSETKNYCVRKGNKTIFYIIE